jgi:IclR family acetate operon transcriptional repressor
MNGWCVMDEGPGVQSVLKALDILEALAACPDGAGVTELGRRLGMKPPTVHNLLQTLARRQYAGKDDATQRYRLGFACAALGRAYLGALRVPDAARRPIEELARQVNESVVVATIQQNEIAFVARASGDRMLAVDFERSWTQAGYGSACGRVILAYLPPERLARYIDAHPIAQARTEDIRSRKDLDAILDQARRKGHLEYWREGRTVLAIAAPIRDHASEVIAAVGIGMPGVRFQERQRPKLVEAVVATADTISTTLGFAPGVSG